MGYAQQRDADAVSRGWPNRKPTMRYTGYNYFVGRQLFLNYQAELMGSHDVPLNHQAFLTHFTDRGVRAVPSFCVIVPYAKYVLDRDPIRLLSEGGNPKVLTLV